MAVRDLRGGDHVRIRYNTLVGADGASSIVRLLLSGRRRRTAVSLEGYVSEQGRDIVFSYPAGRVGYSWYIPTGEVATVGCGLYDGSVADVRSCIAEFCGELGIACPKLRGAPVPTGDDVLLRVGDDVWLIGDAAGLAWPTNGCGIAHALASSRLLAASLAGGTPYEEAMVPTVASFADRAARRNAWFFNTWIRVCRGPKMGDA